MLSTLLFAWLWRGYGLALFFALAATIVPDSRSAHMKMAADYPIRYWRALPLLIAVTSVFTAGASTPPNGIQP